MSNPSSSRPTEGAGMVGQADMDRAPLTAERKTIHPHQPNGSGMS